MKTKIVALLLLSISSHYALSACNQPIPGGGNWYTPPYGSLHTRVLTQDYYKVYEIFEAQAPIDYPNEVWVRAFTLGDPTQGHCYNRYDRATGQPSAPYCYGLTPYGMGVQCPTGYSVGNNGDCYPKDTSNLVCPAPQAKLGHPQFCPAGNPINHATGSKLLIEKDIDLSNVLGFEFKRFYQHNPDDSGLSSSLSYWSYTFNRALEFARMDRVSPSTVVNVKRDDGGIYRFNLVGNNYVGGGTFKHTLSFSFVTSEYQFYDQESDITEFYNTEGRLIRIKEKSDRSKYFTYVDKSGNKYPSNAPSCNISSHFDTSNPLFGGIILGCISNEMGTQLNFKYNTFGFMSELVDPRGDRVSYTYVKKNNYYQLTTVTYPANVVRQYIYEEPANVSSSPASGVYYVNALTGIIDENNDRFATYTYNNLGFAATTEHGVGVEKRTVNYSTNSYGNITSSSVTDSRGATVSYGFDTIDGNVKIATQSQPAGSGCAASASNLTYDVNGNVASRVDFNGNKTTYIHDLTRNVETSRTEGLTTAGAATTATRTITTSWHSTWRLPLVVSTYTGATASGTPVQRTTYTYDTKGNVTSVQEEDPVRALSRTTTTTYTYSSAVPGLVLQKVVDGPRTDVTDTTTYEYYAHDATCTASTATPILDPITGVAPANYGCRGQLKKVTNALGHVTTYDRYNHHGQLEQMTDANSLVTQQTYDLRQRLLTRTVSGSGITTQTTQLTYDNVGQITQLKMQDNSTLNYTYDAAHRLTDIEDTLGNKVHYTLDTEGNRTQEDVYDPNNVLSTTLTRSFDALNRLQTQTGL